MRKLFLSILFLLISLLNYSQNSKIKFGIQGGLNYSNFRGYDIPANISSYYSENPAFAFLGGLNFEYQIKEKLSLKLEFNYERKSQKSKTTLETINVNVNPDPISGGFDELRSKRNHDYLVLPIMIKYNFSNKNSFFVNGGPFIGYLLKSNLVESLYLNRSVKESQTTETTNSYNKTDFGLSIGFGKTIEINERNSIFIEIRENLGLAKSSKNKIWGDGEAKTNSLNLIIGYSLN
ncbi:porin family protein [Flavobacterium sp. HJJ]|uniref:porin family protein n=1 Tax=Flavobacterium sp. HJJ TaxID=2783792 RepID=UPI00188B8B49|nr:porin family protein [Flavobacterium sp. HJJ]MBF4470170.1 PorT family protein [Flavobacterium sp. HJJ]